MFKNTAGLAVLVGLFTGACANKEEAKPKTESAPAEVENLPYFGSTPVPEGATPKTGLGIYEKEFVDPSYRLIALGKLPVALLLAPDGTVAHRWQIEQSPVADILKDDVSEGWQNVEMLPNGDLLALRVGMTLYRINRKSEIIWAKHDTYHHESHVGKDGKIYTLTERYRIIDKATKRGVLDSEVVVLDDAGNTIGDPISIYDAVMAVPELAEKIAQMQNARYSLIESRGPVGAMEEHLRRTDGSRAKIGPNRVADRMRKMISTPEFRAQVEEAYAEGFNRDHPFEETSMILRTIPGSPMDVLHANSIVPLPAHRKGLWSKGDYLISLRELNTILVLSPATKRVLWWWGPGVLDNQHEATYLDNGNILVFDNGAKRKWSRVLTVDPESKAIVRTYGNDNTNKFFSIVAGGVHQLPNENFLINVTMASKILEVTPDWNIVWQYSLPLNDAGTEQFTTYRCNSVTPEAAAALLAGQ